MPRHRSVKELLLNLLAHPAEREAGLVLADFLEKCGHSRAGLVRKSYQTGFIYYTANSSLASNVGSDLPNPVHLVLQLVPQRLAVEFACGCSERVLPLFEAEFPLDNRLGEAVQLLRGWINGKITKREVKQSTWFLGTIRYELEDVPQAPRDQLAEARLGGATFAVATVHQTALAVSPPPSGLKWLPYVCWASCKALDAMAVTTGTAAGEQERQRQGLAQLIERWKHIEATSNLLPTEPPLD